MSGQRQAEPISEERLTGGLSWIYAVGYAGSLLLVTIGIFLSLFSGAGLSTVAVAGVVVLLATPAAAAVWVGIRAAAGRDWRLALVVLGIVLILGATAIIQFTR